MKPLPLCAQGGQGCEKEPRCGSRAGPPARSRPRRGEMGGCLLLGRHTSKKLSGLCLKFCEERGGTKL